MNKTLSILMLAAASIAATAWAQTEAMHVVAMPIASMEDFKQWVAQKPAPKGVFPRLKVATAGKKVSFPIMVSGLHPPEHGELKLVGDLEILTPDGKVAFSARECCRFTITDHPDFRSAVLGPVIDMTFDPGDPKGTYTVRVSVSDGTRTATGTDHFSFGGASSTAQRSARDGRHAERHACGRRAAAAHIPAQGPHRVPRSADEPRDHPLRGRQGLISRLIMPPASSPEASCAAPRRATDHAAAGHSTKSRRTC